MRKLIPILLVLIFATLACQVDTTGLEATANAAKETLLVAVTEAGQAAGTAVAPASGRITGHLSYPSEGIPPLRVVAFRSANLAPVSTVDTVANQLVYELQVPPGSYFIMAYTQDGKLAGGYSQMVPCGLTVACTDHSLIAVPVAAGGTAGGIDPGDWYAPPGTFPPMP
jgi:hypothetical protein